MKASKVQKHKDQLERIADGVEKGKFTHKEAQAVINAHGKIIGYLGAERKYNERKNKTKSISDF